MRILRLIALCAIIISGLGIKNSFGEPEVFKEKYYYLSLLTIEDEGLFDKYRQATRGIIENLGGSIDMEFKVIGEPKGSMLVGLPNRLVVMSFDTQIGLKRLRSSPKYLRHLSLRERAVKDRKTISGDNLFSDHSESEEKNLENRMYVLKISSYYHGRENRINALKEVYKRLRPYRFYTQKRISVRKSVGFGFEVDEEALYFHDNAKLNEQLHKDAEVMGMISSYNKTFVKSFVYLKLQLI